MQQFFVSIENLSENEALVRNRAYGIIETRGGEFVSLKFKPWPKLVSASGAAWAGALRNTRVIQDRCRIFFNQPIGHRNYIALKYIESTLGTTMSTLRKSMRVLDEVARIKRTDAIFAHVTNSRISERLMDRWGWQRHLLHKSGRHFIKRFYGEYEISGSAQAIANCRLNKDRSPEAAAP